ncbi:MAG: diguanylate cyclase [Dehalococcoidia bacterium]|nr:diguanylate cyclase [Dehalococcoidia bacterium]
MIRSWFSSIRVRLLLLLALLFVCALVIMVYSALERRERAARDAEDDVALLARVTAVQHEQTLESARNLLVTLAQLSEVRDGDAVQCSALFARLLKGFPSYTNFSRADMSARNSCSAVPANPPVNVADRDYFQRAIQTRDFVVGQYQVGRASGKPTIPMGYPVLDDTGVVRGVVITGIDLTWLTQLASKASLPPGASLTLLDANGTVVVRYPDDGRFVGASVSDRPVFKIILEKRGEGSAQSVGLDGTPRLYGFTRLRGTPPGGELYLAIGVTSASIYGPIDAELVRNLVLVVVGSLAGLAAMWWSMERLVIHPVQRLVRATARVAGGDLSARAGGPYKTGEIGALAHAFDKMVRMLQAREEETRQAERRLHQSEERFRSLAENAQDIIYRYRLMPTRGFEYVSPVVTPITGYTPQEYYADPDLYLNVVHTEDRHLLGSSSRSFGQPLVLRWRRKDGTLVWIEERNIPVYDAGGGLVAVEGIARDVTDRMQQQHSLIHEAFHDKLTDLPNRAMFLERLGRTMQQAREKQGRAYAVLFMDLDRFKPVNDTLGHEKGDKLLVAVARRLEGCLRAGDIVARLGGDEFTILLPSIADVTMAKMVATRILESVAAPFDLDGQVVRATFSIGIAMCETQQYEQPQDVLRDADTAMYAAKARGRARYEVFEPSMSPHASS